MYFSFRSPYSWLAMRALAAQGLGIGSELEYCPYFEPDGHIRSLLAASGGEIIYRPMHKAKHLYILGDIKRLCSAQGIVPRMPVDDVAPDWSVPHLMFLALDAPDEQRRFAWAIMDARWLRGECVWSWDHCRRVLGDWNSTQHADRLIDSARSQQIRMRCVDVLLRAYKDDVFGVPFIRIGREKFWGSDRVDAFLERYFYVKAISGAPVS